MFSLHQIFLMAKFYSQCPVCGNGNIEIVLTAKDHTVSGELFDVWKCGNCALRFTQSIPDEDEIGKYYQSENYISHSDTAKGFINSLYHKVRNHTLQSKQNLIKSKTALQHGNILDVGAGTGAFLNTMKKGGWNVTGIEPDEIARKNAFALYDLSLKPAQEFYNLPEAFFDAITMWHVLEHVYDLQGYILQLKKLLKPGGVLFIAVPNYTCHDAKVYRQNWAAYDVPRHLYHFSPKAMKELLTKHQLNISQIKPMWFDSFYVSMLSEKYKTEKNNYFSAWITGFISNCKAFFNKKRCSSLIYVIKKVGEAG